jgi:hypothetical protein
MRRDLRGPSLRFIGLKKKKGESVKENGYL